MMRAVIVTETGETEVLQAKDVPEPRPEARQVTINVAFAAVGLVDVLVRRGDAKSLYRRRHIADKLLVNKPIIYELIFSFYLPQNNR